MVVCLAVLALRQTGNLSRGFPLLSGVLARGTGVPLYWGTVPHLPPCDPELDKQTNGWTHLFQNICVHYHLATLNIPTRMESVLC